MELVTGNPWQYVWSPLDIIGLASATGLLEPLAIHAGGCCADCGSTNIRGLTILVKPQIDLFDTEVEHNDRVKVFAVMTCCHWHNFLVPTRFEDELRHWMWDILRENGDGTFARGDVGDALSDRWSRWMPEIKMFEQARLAFGEACRTRLEFTMSWPPANVRLLVPGKDRHTVVPGFREWTLRQREGGE